MLDRGMKSRTGMIWRALMTKTNIVITFYPIIENSGDPAFANARFSGQQHDLSIPLSYLLPAIEQKCDFLLASYKWCLSSCARLEPCLGSAFTDDAPGPHSITKAF